MVDVDFLQDEQAMRFVLVFFFFFFFVLSSPSEALYTQIKKFNINNQKLVSLDNFFLFLFLQNRLNIKWIVCPISSVRRIAKYTSKGYKAKGLQVVKLFAEWSERARKQKNVAAGENVEISGTPDEILKGFSEMNGKLNARFLNGLYMD